MGPTLVAETATSRETPTLVPAGSSARCQLRRDPPGTIVRDTTISCRPHARWAGTSNSMASSLPISLRSLKRQAGRRRSSSRWRRRCIAIWTILLRRCVPSPRKIARHTASTRTIWAMPATLVRPSPHPRGPGEGGSDLTLDSFIAAMESMQDWRDIFGGPAIANPITRQPKFMRTGQGTFCAL
jgi:hypothetical protein